MSQTPPTTESSATAQAAEQSLRRFLDALGAAVAPVYLPPGMARDALRLARILLSPRSDAPPQIAVIGPTQTGKSTLVNALLAREAAEISPLAGFTVHPQGFWLGGPVPEPAKTAPVVQQRTLFELEAQPDEKAAAPPEWVTWALPDWRQCKPGALTRDELEAFALEPLPLNPLTKKLVECVVWDTPDFDSLAAESYRTGLLGVVALADVFVLVVSKEKYADRSVWNWLDLLAPLGRPLVVCLNKLTPDAVGPISSAIIERLSTRETWRTAPLVTLPVLGDVGEYDRAEFKTLREHAAAAAETERPTDTTAAAKLCAAHWRDWTTPVQQEHVALNEWRCLLDNTFEQLLVTYETEYLNRPDRFDSFRRATVELLELLELPVIGGMLTQARTWVTWPARQLWASGRSLLGKPKTSGQRISGELAFLTDELDLLLVELERRVTHHTGPRDAGGAVWTALGQQLVEQRETLRERFHAGAKQHHEHVTREIHAAANELYETLKKSPKLLNTLRSARVTTDVLAVFFAVKSAGLNMYDLVTAPAMFGLTSLLTEGALGSYMHRIAAQLKQRQLADARETLLDGSLRPPLETLTTTTIENDLLGITPEALTQARDAAETLEATS